MDIQNTSTLTGEKLKIKFCSLKLTRPPDEFVIFDTRPKDFIVVSDDLTTANMDPCYVSHAYNYSSIHTDAHIQSNNIITCMLVKNSIIYVTCM